MLRFCLHTGRKEKTVECMVLYAVRSRRSESGGRTHVLIAFSIDHPSAAVVDGAVRGHTVHSYYVIEARGPTRCRLTHITRVDVRSVESLSCLASLTLSVVSSAT